MEKLKPDATGIYVAAHQAPGAIEEAIEAEVPLIVAVAEHIPIHDIMRVCSKSCAYGNRKYGANLADANRYTRCLRRNRNRGSLVRMPQVSFPQLGNAGLDFNLYLVSLREG